MSTQVERAKDGPRVRKATPADVSDIARVHVTCWQETYRGIVPDSILDQFSIARGESVWGRILTEPEAFDGAAVYVVLDERTPTHDIAGFGTCGSQRSTSLAERSFDGEIGTIYVLRACQRRGFGRALMHVMAQDLLARSFHAASLWVLRDNTAARRFYEHCAGTLVGEREDDRGVAVLLEVAYGWPDLRVLCDPMSG